jgi:hypothetical protein
MREAVMLALPPALMALAELESTSRLPGMVSVALPEAVRAPEALGLSRNTYWLTVTVKVTGAEVGPSVSATVRVTV